MRLTAHTDFALRTLMYLAAVGGRTTAGRLAQLYGVSSNHLAKVVNQLARLGYVRSIRGIGGGIELACRPEDVSLAELIEAFEGNLHLLDCVAADDVCVIESFCKLKQALSQAERVQLDYLAGVSLADVTPTVKQYATISAEAS